jgi:tetratricopeptide (TPR) repeat protein
MRHTAILALILLGAVTGCAKDAGIERAAPESACADAGAVVDPVLLAFLSRARSAHHRADAFEERGDLGRAIAELDGLVRGPEPRYAEVHEVLADTRARLADLRSQQGNFAAADLDLAAGLGLAPDRTYFRGHLFEVRGLVEERRSKALHASGDEAGAEAARTRALGAFEQAMAIQAEVIQRALPGGAP